MYLTIGIPIDYIPENKEVIKLESVFREEDIAYLLINHPGGMIELAGNQCEVTDNFTCYSILIIDALLVFF